MMAPRQTLLIERVMDQIRLAVVEDGALCELYCQRPGIENLTGNIYLGRVDNIVTGMNAAFIDIGTKKNGFLSTDDLICKPNQKSAGSENIGRILRPGQSLSVQVLKAQPGAKGPRLTCDISLPGRLMALTPNSRFAGVSRKIEDEDERARLSGIGRDMIGGTDCGVILRTASAGASEHELRCEFERLISLWRRILVKAEHCTAPKLLYDDNDLMLRCIRDRMNDRIDALWVDGASEYAALRALAADLAPEHTDRIRLHEGRTPLFDLYKVDAQADKALQMYVWLKGGGSLVIEETEALTSVDVNTGKNTGKKDVETTIFENNLEAARELIRQLRLRDIGGIVIADFIDMKREEHRNALLEELKTLAALDSNRTTVVDITPLGLVEIKRKKERQSLGRQTLHTCSHCGGNGTVFSHESTARRAIREIWRRRRAGDTSALVCEAPKEVCGWMKTLGAPEGGAVYTHAVQSMEAGEYRLAPADVSALPPDSKPLK